MRASLFILSLLFTLVSCSQGKHTTAKFSLEIGNLALSSAGGLVIFGKENAGAKFTRIASGTSVTLDVPKGTWTFNAMAWDGANGPMTGVIICAQQTGVAVSGDSLSINLKLDNATCFSSAFSNESGMPDGGGNTRAFPLDPYFCETDVSGLTNTACQYDPTMPSLTPRRGFVGSYKFSIPAGVSFGSVSAGETLESECYVAGANNSVSSGNNIGYVNIPALASSLGLPLHIDAYLGAACEPAKGKFHLSFDNQSLAKFGPGPSMKKVYGRTPINGVCAISDLLGTSDFASGVGDSNYPYVICSQKQLLYLQKNTSIAGVNNAFYILGRDINLLGGIGGGSTPADSCLSLGDTFVPIGKYYDGTCTLQNYAAFNGYFDGNNFTISHFRFKDQPSNYTGFISASAGFIVNVTFSKASVEGGTYTGVAAGFMNAAGHLVGVKVIDSDVRGDDYTGGIIGYYAASTSNSDLFVDNVEVEGRNQTGGIFGETSSNTTRAFFNGMIRTNSISDTNIGGIAGRSAGSFDQVVSSGTIRGSHYVGGIVGTSGAITEARSDVLIVDTNSDTTGSAGPPDNQRFIGGIAGDTSVVTAGLFLGNIQTACASANCKVGAIIGNGSGPTSPGSYSVQNPGSLGGVNGTATSFSAVYGGVALTNNLCTNLGGGPPACHWYYNGGDMPRMTGVDDNHPCLQTINNAAFSAQLSADPTKGTQTNPYVICNVTQLKTLNTSAGAYYELKQNLNLIEETALNSIGSFDGKLDGAGHIIHSHKISSGGSIGLFTTITGTSVVKNLILAGFNYSQPGASTNNAPLAQYNLGLVNNVEVSEVKITATSSSAKVGGIVSTNSGIVANSQVSGEIRGVDSVGGIAGDNSGGGTISHNVVRAILKNAMSGVQALGGIAGYNKGTVQKNTFKGELQLGSASSISAVGGIVGYQYYLTSAPVISDNETDQNSKIFFAGSASNNGGIVGNSNNPVNVVKRNITKGLFVDTGTSGAIIGSALYTDEGDSNYTYTTTTSLIGSSSGLSTSVVSGTDLCDITVPVTGSVFAGDGVFVINNQVYFGGMVGTLSSVTLTTQLSAVECLSSLVSGVTSGQVQAYKAATTPVYPTIADLKAENYDVADMSVATDKSRALKAYFELITLGVAVNPPVWMAEGDKPVELFDNH